MGDRYYGVLRSVFPAFDILVTHIKMRTRLINMEELASSVLAVSLHHAYSAYEIFDILRTCSTEHFLADRTTASCGTKLESITHCLFDYHDSTRDSVQPAKMYCRRVESYIVTIYITASG